MTGVADGSDEAVELADDPLPGIVPRLSYVVARLERSVRRELAQRLQPLGLTFQQFTALSVLRARPGLSNAQLARRAMITPQSMIAVISTLEARGLVQRTASPANGRILQATLTEEGNRVLQRCEQTVDELEAQMTADLTAGQAQELLQLMRSCVRRLGGGL